MPRPPLARTANPPPPDDTHDFWSETKGGLKPETRVERKNVGQQPEELSDHRASADRTAGVAAYAGVRCDREQNPKTTQHVVGSSPAHSLEHLAKPHFSTGGSGGSQRCQFSDNGGDRALDYSKRTRTLLDRNLPAGIVACHPAIADLTALHDPAAPRTRNSS